jgi:hypothetical protein
MSGNVELKIAGNGTFAAISGAGECAGRFTKRPLPPFLISQITQPFRKIGIFPSALIGMLQDHHHHPGAGLHRAVQCPI